MFSSLSSWLTGDEKKNNQQQQQQQQQDQQPQQQQQQGKNGRQPLQQQQQQPVPMNRYPSHLENTLMQPNKDTLSDHSAQIWPKNTGNAGLAPTQDSGTSITGQRYLPSSPYLLPYDQALPSAQQQQHRQHYQQQQQQQHSSSHSLQTNQNTLPTIIALPKQDPLSSIQSKKDLWQLYYMDDKAVHQYLNGISSATDISADIETLLYASKQSISTDIDEALAACYPNLLHNDTPSSQLSLIDLSTALARALIVMGGDVGLLNAMADVCKKRAYQIDMISKSHQSQNQSHFGDNSQNQPRTQQQQQHNRNPNTTDNSDQNSPLTPTGTGAILDAPLFNEHVPSPTPQAPTTPSLIPLFKEHNKDALPPPLSLDSITTDLTIHPSTTTKTHINPIQQQQPLHNHKVTTFVYPAHTLPAPQLQLNQPQLCSKCNVTTLATVYKPNRLLNPIQHFCAHTTVFLPSMGDNQAIYDALRRSITLPRPITLRPNGTTIYSPFSSFVQTNPFLINEYMHKYRLIVTTPSLSQEAYHYMLDNKIAMFWYYLAHRPAITTSASGTITHNNTHVSDQQHDLINVPISAAPSIDMVPGTKSKGGKKTEKEPKDKHAPVTTTSHNDIVFPQTHGITDGQSFNSQNHPNIHQLPQMIRHGSSVSYIGPNDMNITYNVNETHIHRSYTSATNSNQEVINDIIDDTLIKVLQNEDLNHEQSKLYSLCESTEIVPLPSPAQSFLSLAIHRTRPQFGFRVKGGDRRTSINANTSTDPSPEPSTPDTSAQQSTRPQLKPSSIQQSVDHGRGISNTDSLNLSNDNNNSTSPPSSSTTLTVSTATTTDTAPTPGELGYYTHCQLNSTIDTRPLLRQGSFVALSFLHHHVHSKIRLSEDNLFLYWLVDTSTASVELRKPASSPLPTPIVKEFTVPLHQDHSFVVDLGDIDNAINLSLDTTQKKKNKNQIDEPFSPGTQAEIYDILNSPVKRHVIHRPSVSATGVDLHHAWRYSANSHDEFLPETNFPLTATLATTQPTSFVATNTTKYSISTHDTAGSLETLNNLITGQLDTFSLPQLSQQALLPSSSDTNSMQIGQHGFVAYHNSHTASLSTTNDHNHQLVHQPGHLLPYHSSTSRPSSLQHQSESLLLRSQRSLLEQVEDNVEAALRRSNSHHSDTSQRHNTNHLNDSSTRNPQHQPFFSSSSSTHSHQPQARPIYDLSASQIPSKPTTYALNLASPVVHRMYATYYDVRVASINDVMLFVQTHVPAQPPQPTTTMPIQTDHDPKENDSKTELDVIPPSRQNRTNSGASVATNALPPQYQPIDLSVNLALYSHLQQRKTRNTHIGTRVQSYPSSLPLSTRGIPIEAIVGLEEFNTIQHPFQHYRNCIHAALTTTNPTTSSPGGEEDGTRHGRFGSGISATSGLTKTPEQQQQQQTQQKLVHDINFDEANCCPLSQQNQYDRLYQHQGCTLHNSAVSTLQDEINKEHTTPDDILTPVLTPVIHPCSTTSPESLCNYHKHHFTPSHTHQPHLHNQTAKPCQCAASHIYGLRIIYEVPQRIPSHASTPQEYWQHVSRIDAENRKLFKHECTVHGWDYDSVFIPYPYLRVYRKQLVVQFVDKNEQLVWSRSIIELKNQFFKIGENDVEQLKKLIVPNMSIYLKMQDFALKNRVKVSRYNTPGNTTLSPALSKALLFSTLPPQLQSQLVDPLGVVIDPKTGLSLKKRFMMDMDNIIPNDTSNIDPTRPAQSQQLTPTPSQQGVVPQPTQQQSTVPNNGTNTDPQNQQQPQQAQPQPQLSGGPQNAMVLRQFTKIHFRLPLVSRIVTPSLLQLLMSQMGRRASLVKWHLGYSLLLDGADIGHLWRGLRGYNHSLFIIRTNDQDIIGGYSGQAWRPEGGYHGNHESFVFRLCQNGTIVDPLHGTKMVNVEQLPASVQYVASAVDIDQLNQPFTSPSLPDDDSPAGLLPSMSTLGVSMSTLQSSMSTLSALNLTGPVELSDQQQRYINDVDLLPLTTFANGIPEIYPWKGPLQYFVFTNRDAFGFGGGGGTALHIWNNLGQGKSEFCGSFQNPQLTKNKEFRIYELEVWVGK